MEVIQKITLDLVARGITPRLAVKQGDAYTRAVEITLCSGGTAWTVPAEATFLVRYRKADGTAGMYDTLPYGATPAVTAEGSVLTVNLAPQMLTCPGLTRCDVVLLSGAEVLATFDFHLVVEPSPVDNATLESQDYYKVASLAQINAALDARIKTVNGIGPDENGNVDVSAGIPSVDATLTQEGKAADAKATGDAIRALSEEIANLQTSGLTTEQINALDGMFKVCAFIKADISAEYNAFRTAFDIEAATITGISATYSGGSVPADTALSDLTGIVVTATYSDGSTETVTGYTLSGEIAEGNNTITVTYQGKTATFIVTGTAVAQTYTVTNNLTNVTNSNSATTASSYYSATLSVEDGYTISVVITMGGVDITDSSYTEDGTILITEVTGDIVITATAELASAYTVLYQLSDTPKSVSGLSEDTGITFGAEDANGYTKALTICVAYTGFDANETLMKMSSGRALEVTTNAGGSNTQIRVTSCSNSVTVNPEISDSGDYRVIITKEATSVKTLNIHTLSSGAVATAENVGTYGNFSHSACAGNLIVGDSDITVNKLVIYEGILSDAHIATFLSGGEV